MGYIIYFLILFIILYIISYITMVRKKNSINDGRVPTEVVFLVKRYNIDVNKVNYHKFLRNIAVLGSFDMALAVFIVSAIDNIWLKLGLGFVILIPLILISFGIFGKIYQKKGCVRDEHKKNRK